MISETEQFLDFQILNNITQVTLPSHPFQGQRQKYLSLIYANWEIGQLPDGVNAMYNRDWTNMIIEYKGNNCTKPVWQRNWIFPIPIWQGTNNLSYNCINIYADCAKEWTSLGTTIQLLGTLTVDITNGITSTVLCYESTQQNIQYIPLGIDQQYITLTTKLVTRNNGTITAPDYLQYPQDVEGDLFKGADLENPFQPQPILDRPLHIRLKITYL